MAVHLLRKAVPAVACVWGLAMAAGPAHAQDIWKSPLSPAETKQFVEYLQRIGAACFATYGKACPVSRVQVPEYVPYVLTTDYFYAPGVIPAYVEEGARVALCDLPKYRALCKAAFK